MSVICFFTQILKKHSEYVGVFCILYFLRGTVTYFYKVKFSVFDNIPDKEL